MILLSRSARALFRGVYEDRGKILLGIAVIFSALIGLTALLSRSITRPIEALSVATRAVATGGGAIAEPPATAAIEIQDLYRDFAVMAAAIDRRSRYLRDFAHAVSHEFKTPLAGIRGVLELMADHAMSDADRRRFLANADADTLRLQHLVTRLLELARADMSRPTHAVATDLSQVATTVVATTQSDGFEVRVALSGLSPVAIPAGSIERVLVTLIENSRQAGSHCVAITGRQHAASVVITIADDGPGIAPADRLRIFEPFFTTRRSSGGSGLGLAIARSLLDAAGGTIALLGTTSGTSFALTLPIER